MQSQGDSASKSQEAKDPSSPKEIKIDSNYSDNGIEDAKKAIKTNTDEISVTEKSVEQKDPSDILLDKNNYATVFSNRAESIDQKINKDVKENDKEEAVDKSKEEGKQSL